MSFDQIAHNLGWDYAAHGRRFSQIDKNIDAMVQGYTAGCEHFKYKTIEPDIYDRKWLQIRYHALLRKRVFDDEVTPDFLRSINRGICTVTYKPLTRSKLEDSDWSVDRIINDGGYTPDNLMIISNIANKVKGDKSLEEVGHYALDGAVDERLTKAEWLRLYSVMQTAYHHAGLITDETYLLLPMTSYRPPHIPWHWYEKLQWCFISFAQQKGLLCKTPRGDYKTEFFKEVKTTCASGTANKMSTKLIHRLRRKLDTVRFPLDLWWNKTHLMMLHDLIALQQDKGVWPAALKNVAKKYDHVDDAARVSELHSSMALDTQGYLIA